jgi:hypothetical protein
VRHVCRAMVEDRESRVDFGMGEALAFGTLALHRGVRPPAAFLEGGSPSRPSALPSQPQLQDAAGAPCFLSSSQADVKGIVSEAAKLLRWSAAAPHKWLCHLCWLAAQNARGVSLSVGRG